MPRLTKKLPAYRLHRPSGQARVRHQGREIWLGIHGSPESLEKYSRFLAEISARDGAGIDSPVPPQSRCVLSVAELIEKFWEHARRYYVRDGEPTGESVVIRSALRPVLKLYGSTPVTEFGPKRLKAVREAMIELGWSRRYINASIKRVRRMFTWAASEELITGTIAVSLQTVQGLRKDRSAAREKPEVKPVPDDVVEATLVHLGPVVADMVRVQRLTGMRPGELLAMTPDAVDRSDPGCWSYRPEHHKTEHHEKDRVVWIGPRAIEILASHLLAAGRGRVFDYSRDSYRRAIARACDRAFPHPSLSGRKTRSLNESEAAELESWRSERRWSPNQLRHSAGTEIRRRFGLEGSQVVLGHSRADVTQVYAESNMEKAKEIARLVG